MDSNVIPLGNVTRLDTPVDKVLENSHGKMSEVILLGYDKDGEFYFASTFADGGSVMWLLEQCKKRLLEVDVDG